ncbi:unnamed protein product, partial [Meganyctiphanes norvegica]
MNDMIHCLNAFFLSQFADNSTLTYSSLNIDQALLTVETEINHVLEWLAANKLIIDLNKTPLMVLKIQTGPLSISITANEQIINEVTETKFMGVILDNKLSWNAHINYISKKISVYLKNAL